jgi:leucyl/phenylalanyl-tRNA--protein transferase
MFSSVFRSRFAHFDIIDKLSMNHPKWGEDRVSPRSVGVLSMLDWLMEFLYAPMIESRDMVPRFLPWVDPESVDDVGLVGVGGELSPEILLLAYRQGVFPMQEAGDPVCWWSPNPRGIFDIKTFTISRRLARTVRSGKFQITFDECFAEVVHGCSEREEGTWITPEMIEAYVGLHRLGYAHSVEVWSNGLLVGGVYGVAIGGFFAGESMFYRVRDASKVALVHLFAHLRQRGFVLFDTQIVNDHTRTLGAYEISRSEYLRWLRKALDMSVSFYPLPLEASSSVLELILGDVRD